MFAPKVFREALVGVVVKGHEGSSRGVVRALLSCHTSSRPPSSPHIGERVRVLQDKPLDRWPCGTLTRHNRASDGRAQPSWLRREIRVALFSNFGLPSVYIVHGHRTGSSLRWLLAYSLVGQQHQRDEVSLQTIKVEFEYHRDRTRIGR